MYENNYARALREAKVQFEICDLDWDDQTEILLELVRRESNYDATPTTRAAITEAVMFFNRYLIDYHDCNFNQFLYPKHFK
jgi:hypothetical protein